MQVGGPIDNIIIDSYKFIGREPTQEEIDELKNKYQGDTEKAMNDFYSVLKTYTNETPDLRKKVALKSYYKVPLNFAETMALSENTSLNPAEENRTTKAKGYFQIIERWHKDDIQNIYGKDFQTAMQDPSIQEDYMYKYLVPSYEKRIPNLKELFNQGYEKGVLDKYKPFMIGGRFTDDQLKAIQHVLGPTGAANLLTTGQTVDEGQKRDVQRALSKMVSLRKQYGVPTSLSSQYDFDKFGIGDILPYDILAAGEDKVEETSAPKTVPYQQAPLAPGRTKADLISPFLPKQEPKAEEEPKPKPKPIKERYGYSWEQGQTVAPKTIEPPKPASYAITETPVTKRENLIKSEGVKKQEFVESTAALKELEERNTYENYKEKPIDFENLTPEVIQARDEIQQVVANQNRRLSSSEALLRIQFGDTVTRDIQDVLANNANYTKTINNLEEKLKGKYGNNTPAKIDFGPLAEQNNEISENIKYIGTQINGIDSQLEGIQKKLDELDSDPNITPARYNVLNANLVLEYNGLIGQKNELIEKGKILEKDLEGIVAQQNAIINDYNKRAKAEFASDPDVQELNRTYEKYKQNWDKINNYKKSPYFDSYLDSISTLSELDPIYKNLFPDKMRGEQRSKQLAKLAQDIVTEKKTDSYLLNEALIGFYDIYNGVKSLFTDAPAVGYTSIGMNALKGATFNLVGDILASAATISDFAGAEKLGRELRAGDLFGFTVTGAGIEQDVARGAVRSDIAGNPVENYYTVKENDTQLFGIGLTPGDKIIVEDGSPILYRDQNDFKINLFTLPGKNPTLIVKDFLKGKENQIEEDLSIARTVVSALPSAVDMISLIGFNAAAIPRLSKFIASKGLRTAAGMTLNFGAQTFQQYGDLYKSYLDEGKSAQKAAKFALGQSAGVALIELLNPLEMKVASIGGDAAVSQFRKVLDTTVDLYSRGQIGLLDTINAIATGFVATTGAEISKETITELFQGAFENQVQNYASNENKSYTLNEAENTAWTTVAITTIPSFFLGAASYRTAKADIITSAIYNATKDPAKFEADTLKALKDGKMDIPDSASIFNFVGYIKEELDTYENLTDEQGAALSGLIGTRYSLENKKKNSNNEVVKKKIDEQIQEINTTIEEVAKGNKKVEVDPFVKPFYEEEGQPEADRVPTKKEFSDVVYATMPKEWQDMSKEEAWKSFQELTVQDQIKFFNTATGKKEEVATPSTTAAGLTKEQQTELDKVNKRAERIQRTLQEDTEVQEEGDEPLLTAEQKKKLETELQTLNQRRDAIQKQSTAEVPVQPGAEGRQGVGGQVQAKPEVTTREGQEAKIQAEEETIDSFIAQEAANVEITLALDDVNNRMNNAEYIEEKELNQRADQLYSIWDRIDSNPNLTNEQKESLKSKVETQIQKLEQYELATATKVGETVETRTVKGPRVIGTTTKKSPSKYEVTPERIAETKTTTVTDKKGNKKTGTWEVLPNGSLQVTDAKGNVVPVVDGYSFKETVKDKDGNVTAAVLEDKGTGTTFTVDNPDLALDIAIKAKEMELGPIEEGVFERVLQEVKTKAEPVLTREAKEAPQAKKAEAPTPTPTTTEKVSQKAAEAPKKANTVQGFEITRKDGSKLPASDYVKDKKTGKWKRVAADGTTKGVSFAPYVKQLEDALSSPAAAETKKTEPTPTEVAETPIPKNKVRASFNIENAGRLKTIQTTPTFKNIFSEEQLKNLKVGENTVDLNMTAWGKAQRMLDAKDVTKKTEPTPAKAPNALKDVESTAKALEGKDVSNLKIRNLDTEIEYNRGDDITSLKSAINNGLGEDRKLSRNEIEALSNLEFTIFPKQDVDRSNTDIPIIIIKKRGHSFENVQEALDYLQSQEADFTDNLSDYFEIVDGRHRVKKAIDNNLPLSTVLITEKDYEDFTNRQLFSDRNDTNNIEKILSDIGARNIEDGIEFLSKEKETTDILEKLNYLEEEKKFRDSNNANTPKSVIDRNIAEAYHKAKKDGSNPESVKAVEDLLGVAPSPTAAETQVEAEAEPAPTGKAEARPTEEKVEVLGASTLSKKYQRYIARILATPGFSPEYVDALMNNAPMKSPAKDADVRKLANDFVDNLNTLEDYEEGFTELIKQYAARFEAIANNYEEANKGSWEVYAMRLIHSRVVDNFSPQDAINITLKTANIATTLGQGLRMYGLVDPALLHILHFSKHSLTEKQLFEQEAAEGSGVTVQQTIDNILEIYDSATAEQKEELKKRIAKEIKDQAKKETDKEKGPQPPKAETPPNEEAKNSKKDLIQYFDSKAKEYLKSFENRIGKGLTSGLDIDALIDYAMYLYYASAGSVVKAKRAFEKKFGEKTTQENWDTILESQQFEDATLDIAQQKLIFAIDRSGNPDEYTGVKTQNMTPSQMIIQSLSRYLLNKNKKPATKKDFQDIIKQKDLDINTLSQLRLDILGGLLSETPEKRAEILNQVDDLLVALSKDKLDTIAAPWVKKTVIRQSIKENLDNMFLTVDNMIDDLINRRVLTGAVVEEFIQRTGFTKEQAAPYVKIIQENIDEVINKRVEAKINKAIKDAYGIDIVKMEESIKHLTNTIPQMQKTFEDKRKELDSAIRSGATKDEVTRLQQELKSAKEILANNKERLKGLKAKRKQGATKLEKRAKGLAKAPSFEAIADIIKNGGLSDENIKGIFAESIGAKNFTHKDAETLRALYKRLDESLFRVDQKEAKEAIAKFIYSFKMDSDKEIFVEMLDSYAYANMLGAFKTQDLAVTSGYMTFAFDASLGAGFQVIKDIVNLFIPSRSNDFKNTRILLDAFINLKNSQFSFNKFVDVFLGREGASLTELSMGEDKGRKTVTNIDDSITYLDKVRMRRDEAIKKGQKAKAFFLNFMIGQNIASRGLLAADYMVTNTLYPYAVYRNITAQAMQELKDAGYMSTNYADLRKAVERGMGKDQLEQQLKNEGLTPTVTNKDGKVIKSEKYKKRKAEILFEFTGNGSNLALIQAEDQMRRIAYTGRIAGFSGEAVQRLNKAFNSISKRGAKDGERNFGSMLLASLTRLATVPFAGAQFRHIQNTKNATPFGIFQFRKQNKKGLTDIFFSEYNYYNPYTGDIETVPATIFEKEERWIKATLPIVITLYTLASLIDFEDEEDIKIKSDEHIFTTAYSPTMKKKIEASGATYEPYAIYEKKGNRYERVMSYKDYPQLWGYSIIGRLQEKLLFDQEAAKSGGETEGQPKDPMSKGEAFTTAIAATMAFSTQGGFSTGMGLGVSLAEIAEGAVEPTWDSFKDYSLAKVGKGFIRQITPFSALQSEIDNYYSLTGASKKEGLTGMSKVLDDMILFRPFIENTDFDILGEDVIKGPYGPPITTIGTKAVQGLGHAMNGSRYSKYPGARDLITRYPDLDPIKEFRFGAMSSSDYKGTTVEPPSDPQVNYDLLRAAQTEKATIIEEQYDKLTNLNKLELEKALEKINRDVNSKVKLDYVRSRLLLMYDEDVVNRLKKPKDINDFMVKEGIILRADGYLGIQDYEEAYFRYDEQKPE